MRKLLFILAILSAFNVCVSGQAPGYDFSRARLFSGFDGKLCKISPDIATDWNGTMLLSFNKLLLTGSDVFYGCEMYKSEDNGLSWNRQEPGNALEGKYEDGCRISFSVTPHYSRYYSRWYATGGDTKYINDKVPFQKMVNGKPWKRPYFADIDIDSGEVSQLKEIPFPFEYGGVCLYGEPLELENGDIILLFYYITPDQTEKKYKVIAVRYRFAGQGLEIVEAGKPIECPELNRGISEPSLILFKGKYYLTLRSDERGMFCVSEDGLNFGPIKTWCWEDGAAIGNKNTQQHWVNLGDKLFLAYTRENGANNHVFRNRAPVYTAQFDTEAGCLIRDTEFALIPELGARLGNFCTISDGNGRAYLVTAEWMQPIGCEKYGSDNSIWFVGFKPCSK